MTRPEMAESLGSAPVFCSGDILRAKLGLVSLENNKKPCFSCARQMELWLL
jgi:hypothetical protein